MDDNAFKISIDGKTITFDVDDLELAEVELLEEHMDAAIEEIDFGRAKALRVLVYLLLHRQDETFTLEDAGHIKLGQFAEPNGNGAVEAPKRPTKAARAAKSGATS